MTLHDAPAEGTQQLSWTLVDPDLRPLLSPSLGSHQSLPRPPPAPMLTSSLTLERVAAPGRAALRAARPARGRLAVQANTLWSLTPDQKWCKANPKACSALAPLDLTGAIGVKRLVSVGTADFGSSHDECIDFTVLDHGEGRER